MKKQKGMSLIELMVGLTISLIVILAMFTLYRYAVRNIFGSSDNRGLVANARQDGELATALLTIQNRLQSAGFGFSATVANHFVLVSGASLSANNTVSSSSSPAAQSVSATSASGNAVFWESNPDLAGSTDSYRCTGILSDASTKAVYLLEKTGGCHPVSTTWSSVPWTKTTLIAANVLASQLTFSASASSSTCTPFGLDALKVVSSGASSSSSSSSTVVVTPTPVPNAGLHVLINYSNSTTNSSNSYSVCLQNYPS